MTANTPTSPPERERPSDGAESARRADAPGASPTITQGGPAPYAGLAPTEPDRVRGPHVAAVLLGLACLVIAGLVLGQELGDLSIDWGEVGPLGIVAAGAVLVVLGALGLAASRRTRP